MSENRTIDESLDQIIQPGLDNVKRKNKLNPNHLINIVLIIGLIVIYLLFFFYGKEQKSTGLYKTDPGIEHSSQSNQIAFVDTDEIMEKYTLVIDMTKQLEQKMERMEAEIMAKQQSYEKDASYFQEQVAKKSITEKSAQLIYEKLMDEQQKLVDLRDSYRDQIAREEYNMNIVLVDSITNFLRRYNLHFNYDYILGYSHGGGILLAKDTFNITDEVIESMNREYLDKSK